MQEFRINETIILGIDHGYGNIKTRHTVTRTDVKRQDGKPVFSKNYVEYNGAFYIVGEGHNECKGVPCCWTSFKVGAVSA